MGTLISFSGIDGAGKSTQIELLLKYLKNNGKKVYATEVMFSYFLLKPLVELLRKATDSPRGGPVRRNERHVPKLWFIPAFIDIWVGYTFKIRPLLARYDFVLADRFYTDIWANLLYYGYLPNWAFVSFVRLLPKSDIVFILSVDPKTVRKREDDFPITYYYEQSKIYNRLMKSTDCIVIDANVDKMVVFENIIQKCSI